MVDHGTCESNVYPEVDRSLDEQENVSITSFNGLSMMGVLECLSYLIGAPPCWIKVPKPVGVKKAGMPAPPARIFSARVPCGVSSTSSSPSRQTARIEHELECDEQILLRYCRSNSAFSPTYEEIMRLICMRKLRKTKRRIESRLTCLVFNNKPRPKSSTPQLFETTIRSFWPVLMSALMRFSGIPHKPKPSWYNHLLHLRRAGEHHSPPTSSLAPCGISWTISLKSVKIFCWGPTVDRLRRRF